MKWIGDNDKGAQPSARYLVLNKRECNTAIPKAVNRVGSKILT